ncbi:MAG: hypothetical protein R3E96_07720 [Planctomycetota bacterium]
MLQASVHRADGTVLEAEIGSSGRRVSCKSTSRCQQVGDVVDLEWRRDELQSGVFGTISA